MVQEKLPLPQPSSWADEAGSRVRASWRVAPPLPDITGDAFARALLRCGWSVEDQDDGQCRLMNGGRDLTVPHGRLDPSVVPVLAVEAGIGPLTLMSALEQMLKAGMGHFEQLGMVELAAVA